MRIRYRPAAVAQLDTIFVRIAANNPGAAEKVISTIKRSIERLADFPYSARPSKIAGIRELSIVRYPYLIFYAVDEDADEVQILRIQHTSQEPLGRLDQIH